MANHKGLFITLEGIEGAGKSTQLGFLASLLETQGHEVVITREPGGTRTGERVREILLDNETQNLHPETELLLMFAARMQHYQELIKPALEANKLVISDRFTDASYAYQGGGRGINREKIDQLRVWVLGDFKPDLTLLFDIDAELGLKRAENRSEADRFEQEQLSFFESVRQCYLQLAREEPKRIRIIDASESIQQIQVKIKHILTEYDLCP